MVLVITSLIYIHQNYADDSLARLFMDSYSKEADEWLNKLNTVNGNLAFENSTIKSQSRFSKNNQFEKIQAVNLIKNGRNLLRNEVVNLLIPEHYYLLKRSSEKEKFSIKSIGTPPLDSLKYENYDGVYLMAPLGIRPIFLHKQIEKSTFELIEVSRVTDNPTAIKVKYRFGNRTPKLISQVILDTSNHWSVLSQEIFEDSNQKPILQMNVTYDQPLNGFSMPRTVQVTRGGIADPISTYSNWNLNLTPESDFDLVAFGFDDRITGSKVGSLRFIALCILGGGFLLILIVHGMIFRKTKRDN